MDLLVCDDKRKMTRVLGRWKHKIKLTKVKDLIRLDKRVLVMCAMSFSFGLFVNFLMTGSPDRSEFDLTIKPTGPEVFLVVLVLSGTGNVKQREAVRGTWLSDKRDDVRHFFVLSLGGAGPDEVRAVEEEHAKYNDLLVFTDIDDSFRLLTKRVLASFAWLAGIKTKSPTTKDFTGFRYVLKCDDDSFVRVGDVVDELRSKVSGDKVYWGFFNGAARPHSRGKYKESKWVICDHYLPYALGGGYVLGEALVRYIARNHDDLTEYNSEDISVGAWLATYKDIKRMHDPRFDTEYLSRGCRDAYLVTHKQTAEEMRLLHGNLKKTGRLCRSEVRTRLSYMYNWTVPPSKCCVRNDPSVP